MICTSTLPVVTAYTYLTEYQSGVKSFLFAAIIKSFRHKMLINNVLGIFEVTYSPRDLELTSTSSRSTYGLDSQQWLENSTCWLYVTRKVLDNCLPLSAVKRTWDQQSVGGPSCSMGGDKSLIMYNYDGPVAWLSVHWSRYPSFSSLLCCVIFSREEIISRHECTVSPITLPIVENKGN